MDNLLEPAIIEKPNNSIPLSFIYYILKSIHDILAGENINDNIKIFYTYSQALHTLNLDYKFDHVVNLICANLAKTIAQLSNEIRSLEVFPNNKVMKEELQFDINNIMFYIVHWNEHIKNLNEGYLNENIDKD